VIPIRRADSLPAEGAPARPTNTSFEQAMGKMPVHKNEYQNDGVQHSGQSRREKTIHYARIVLGNLGPSQLPPKSFSFNKTRA
jgi:hypothetical protein